MNESEIEAGGPDDTGAEPLLRTLAPHVLAAVVLQPIYSGFRRLAPRVPIVHRAGKSLMRLAMLGTPMARPDAAGRPESKPAALFRIARSAGPVRMIERTSDR